MPMDRTLRLISVRAVILGALLELRRTAMTIRDAISHEQRFAARSENEPIGHEEPLLLQRAALCRR
jgi:hypothetical protein